MANNALVLDGSDNSDDEVCAHQPNFVGAFIDSLESVKNTTLKSLKEVTCVEEALITLLHLFWRASVSPPLLIRLFVG